MTILELREKRAKAWEAAKNFLDSHRNDKGILSAEDDATYTRMENEIADPGKEIARLERQEALERRLHLAAFLCVFLPAFQYFLIKPVMNTRTTSPRTAYRSRRRFLFRHTPSRQAGAHTLVGGHKREDPPHGCSHAEDSVCAAVCTALSAGLRDPAEPGSGLISSDPAQPVRIYSPRPCGRSPCQ